MSNSAYEKTMESEQNQSRVQLVTTENMEQKYIRKNYFKLYKIIHENLTAAVGACILDLAKEHMFSFHYNVMKQEFNEIKVLYSDTDFLLYEIQPSDLYTNIERMKQSIYGFQQLSLRTSVTQHRKQESDIKDERRTGWIRAKNPLLA